MPITANTTYGASKLARERYAEYVENPIPDSVYVHDTCADPTRIKEAAGWEPEIDFEEGIRRVYAQYR